MFQNKKITVPQESISSSYLTDLNASVITPTIGRDQEIERMIEVLCRKDKSNPILVGDPGVGKTSVVRGLVEKIQNGNVPQNLINKKIYSLDISALNNLEVVKGLFNEVIKNKDIIFIDEIHNIVGAGRQHGSLDLGNILKPLLSSGDLVCIGATTFDEYHKYFEKDSALERRFQKVIIDIPSDEDTFKIIMGIKSGYEAHHRIQISDEAIEAAIKLSKRYIHDRQLPDKAIDLIDEAGSRLSIKLKDSIKVQEEIDELMLRGEGEKASRLRYEKIPFDIRSNILNADDIAEIISHITRIPIDKLKSGEREKLLKVEEILRGRLVGQNQAIQVIADNLFTTRLGIKQKNSSFLFLGSTGVGKTECAKTLAEYLFDDENAMIRVDMSEYSEKHSVSKFIGSPAGYVGYEEGGRFTEEVRKRPYSVILFDEVEKAHPDVFNLFLQMLDESRLTDSQGRTISFLNTIIIMTSNLSLEGLKEFFRPEFLNRIDEIVMFNKLSKAHIKQITLKEIEKIQEKFLESNQVNVLITDDLMTSIIEAGYSEEYGARPLKRIIHKYIAVPASRKIIKENLSHTSLLLKRP